MNVLDVLRGDMGDAGRKAWDCAENPVPACLEILDEFIGEHEVVEVDHYAGPNDRRCWDDCVLSDRAPEAIIVPRKPEPRITDHTLTERMAVLEDEVKERCGDLGRRVHLLEYRTAQKVAIATMAAGIKRDRPLLEAAERLLNAMSEWGEQGEVVADAGDALSAAIKKERER